MGFSNESEYCCQTFNLILQRGYRVYYRKAIVVYALKHLQTHRLLAEDLVVIPFRYFAVESRIPEHWLLPTFGDRVA